MTNQTAAGVQKRYFDLGEVAQALSIEVKEIVHIAAHGDLPVFVLAGGWLADAFVLDDNGRDWRRSSPLQGTKISGPVRIYPEDMQSYEGNSDVAIDRLMGDTGEYDSDEPEEVWEYRLRESIVLADCKLVVIATDLKLQESEPSPDSKPLETRERNSLLKLIATLALQGGYDLNHAFKAGVALSNATEQYGVPVGQKTVGKHLQAALATGAKLNKE